LTSTSTDAGPGTVTGEIKSYQWDCGNLTSGDPAAASSTCTYTVAATSQTFTIKLTVKDNGLGGAGPNYACQKSGTVQRTVTIPGSASQ
jgi:hypothetical protein